MNPRTRRLFENIAVYVLSRRPGLRRNLVRCGDFISRLSGMDMVNEMQSNGELVVQDIVLKHAPRTGKTVIFDVGANTGDWTRRLLEKSRAIGRNDVEVHAFEPCQATYQMLQETLKSCGMEDKVVAVAKALSNSAGTAVFHVRGDGVGTNSLHDVGRHCVRTEKISKTKLDDYCCEEAVKHITFLKVDTEGHDLSVLEGASEMLARGDIGVIQFEYNWRWIFNRHYLKDAFEFLKRFGYRIGKITPKAIEFYDAWDWHLETFRDVNYLGCRKEWIGRFPKIQWWYKA